VFNKIKNFIMGLLLLHILWVAGTAFVNDRVIPSPILVYPHMGLDFWSDMAIHVRYSLWRLAAALSLSLLIGLVFGMLMARSKIAKNILNPFVYLTYPIPKMAFLPVVMIIMGLGNPTIITMIILIIVFQVIINVRDGIASIPVENYQTLLVLGAGKWQLFKDVTVPAALSQILSSSRVALGTATAILFITEGNGVRYGVGHYIMNASVRLAYVDMFAGIVVLSIVAFVLFLFIDILESIFMKWNKS